jgi:hypothetical protein
LEEVTPGVTEDSFLSTRGPNSLAIPPFMGPRVRLLVLRAGVGPADTEAPHPSQNLESAGI